MRPLHCIIKHQKWPLAREFRISRGAKTQADVLTVLLSDGYHVGWAEAVPYNRYGETIDSVKKEIYACVRQLTTQSTPADLLELLPASAARNALDCALWDLIAKRENKAVHELIGEPKPNTCTTAQTLSIGSIDEMSEAAKEIAHQPLIKIKLDNQLVLERMHAIHSAAPQSKFIIDANEAWSFDELKAWLPQLANMNVALIEQPLPADEDDALIDLSPEIPLCADESCHTSDDLVRLKGRYQAVNIKLDKTGGLTEALALLEAAKKEGFIIMTGCMVGSSLAMAPAFLIAQHAAFVDLDGPLLLAKDRLFAFPFDNAEMHPMPMQLWGGNANYLNRELLSLLPKKYLM
ncbi:MAG: N-acetyl-D-Glu racemase DgcA [Psychrobium sp.]